MVDVFHTTKTKTTKTQFPFTFSLFASPLLPFMAAHTSNCASSSSCKSLQFFQHVRKPDKTHFPSSFTSFPFSSPPWMTTQLSATSSSASPPPPTLDGDPPPTALPIFEITFETSNPWRAKNTTHIGNQDDFIRELLKNPGTEKSAMEMYEKSKKISGFRPSKQTVNALLNCLVKSRRWDSISTVMDDLRRYKVSLDDATCHRLVGACVKARKFRLVDVISQVLKDSPAVEAAMKGYNKLHMYSSSVAAYEQMKSLRIALDPNGYCLIMEAYMKMGKPNKVLELFNDLESKDRLKSTSNPARIYEILVEALGLSGEAFKALDYFNNMSAQGIPTNSTIYSSLIKSFSSAGEVEIVEQLVEEARQNQMLKDPDLFLKLVLMYVIQGLIEKTLDIVQIMQDLNIRVSDCIFCAIVNGFAKQRGPRSAISVHKKLVSCGIKPGQVTLASILNVYIRLGLNSEAETVFEEMETRGFDKCVVAYSSMVVMYGKTGRLREAMRMLAKMKAKGCNPNVWVYNNLIDFHGRAKNVRNVEKIWKEMKRRKVVADRVSYTGLMKAYGKAGEYEKGVEVYMEFRMNGGVADPAMAGTMVGVLSRAGRVDELVRLLQDMKAEGTRMDERLCRSAFSALREAGLQVQMSWLEEKGGLLL